MYELVFLSGPRAGEMVPVRGNLLAGRSPDCSLEVPDPNASRKHTQILWDGSNLTCADNGSSNGTFVNELRLTQPVLLKPGDVVRLGETRLRVQRPALGSNQGLQGSSIFSFKDQESDISNSIVMPVSTGDSLPRRAINAEALTARLTAINKVSKALEAIDHPEVVHQLILDALFEVFPQAERGFLMQGDTADTLEPRAVKQRGRSDDNSLNVSKSICRKALESKSAFLFNDQNAGDFDQGMSIVSLRIRSAMTIPLVTSGEKVLGILQIDTGDSVRAFTADDLDLAVTASRIAAAAVNNADLLASNDKLSSTRNNLLRFLPGPLAEQVLSGNLDIALGGKTYQGTILFSDIIGFTRMSENMLPDAVIGMMNEYFGRMVPCIEHEAGSVDKFIGDAIMAFWGIPFNKGDAANAACHAGLNMQNALLGLNSLQRQAGKPDLLTGIGLNTGTVVAGNIGVAQRSEYTLLGDAVNTASRIEHAAGRGQVLISQATLDEVKGAGYGIRMPPLNAKNKAEPLVVISLRALKMGDEVVLHVPATVNGKPITLIRRLSDQTVIALHGADCDPSAGPLLSSITEWPGTNLGTATLITTLTHQPSDGTLIRSHLRLGDPTLGNLISETPTVSPLAWDQMIR